MKHDALIIELLACGKLVVDGDWILIRRDMLPDRGSYFPAVYRLNHDGYLWTSVWWHGRAYNLRVHRVIWVAHHGSTPFEIDHCDDRRDNPALGNLNPLTHQENTQKMWERHRLFEAGEIPDAALLPDERPKVGAEPF